MNKSTGKWIIIGLVILLIILHHDVWNWDNKEPVFGFMPMLYCGKQEFHLVLAPRGF